MSARDRRLAATKYKDQKSATQKARETKSSSSDAKSAMAKVIAQPRSPESIERAAKHRRSLPRLG